MARKKRSGNDDNKVVDSVLVCGAMLLLTLLQIQALACDVTELDLWIGDNVGDAESKNEGTVYKCAGDSLGWYVEWDAGDADWPGFEGEIFIGGTSAGEFDADGDATSASGSVSLSYDISAGDHSVVVWMRREGGEWFESNECTVNVSADPSFEDIIIAYTKAGYTSHSLSTRWLAPPLFDDVAYDADLACYCCDDEDHRTSLGNGFDHAHFPVGFPFSYDIDEDGNPETITAADSRAFWDGSIYSSYTFVSAATCGQNCHGFALGLSTWINGSGMTTILADDYVELFGDDIPQATFATKNHPAGSNPGHSIKIVEWEDGKIKERQEKNGESPVYKKTYSPPIDPPGDWRYWKPKSE